MRRPPFPRMKPSKALKCPVCGRQGDWFAGPTGPFCSKRCKWVDLGRWLGEEHRLSQPLRPSDFDGYDRLPPGAPLDLPD